VTDTELAEPSTSAPSTPRRKRRRASLRRTVLEWVAVALVAAVLALGIRTFALQAFYVPSPSMVPTLEVGDRILVQKLFFSPSDLHTGDIIVFHGPAADAICGPAEDDLVKRVIGLPGETVSSVGNTVYINNKPLREPWLSKNEQLGKPITTQKVPPGEYFVMGDNRPVSCDSRYWGDVPAQSIIGKVILRWWHNGLPDLHFF
jgi:signal peptidase I